MQSLCDNSGKCELILIILSLLHAAMNCGRSCYIIRHLSLNLLPNYLAKFECYVYHFTRVIQFKSVKIVYLQ